MKVTISKTVLEIPELDVVALVAAALGYKDLDVEDNGGNVAIHSVGPNGPSTVKGRDRKAACLAFLNLVGVT